MTLCQAFTKQWKPCPHVLFAWYDGLPLCHLHHPDAPFRRKHPYKRPQALQRTQRKIWPTAGVRGLKVLHPLLQGFPVDEETGEEIFDDMHGPVYVNRVVREADPASPEAPPF